MAGFTGKRKGTPSILLGGRLLNKDTPGSRFPRKELFLAYIPKNAGLFLSNHRFLSSALVSHFLGLLAILLASKSL